MIETTEHKDAKLQKLITTELTRIRDSGAYSTHSTSLLEKALANVKSVEVAQTHIANWEKEYNLQPSEVVTEIMDHLTRLATVIEGNPLSEEKSLGSKITTMTLQLLARSSAIFPRKFWEHAQSALKIAKGATNQTSELVIQKLGTALDQPNSKENKLRQELLNILRPVENSTVQSQRLRFELLQKLVDNWWPNRVGRHNIIDSGNPTKDQIAIEPIAGKDQVIKSKGYYTSGYGYQNELPFSRETKSYNYWDLALHTIYLKLRTRIFDRKSAWKPGGPTPLPLRPESGYFAIISDDTDPNNIVKLNISLDLIKGDYQTFFNQLITQIDKALRYTKDELSLENNARLIRRPTKDEIDHHIRNGIKEELIQDEKVQQDLRNLSSPLAADIQILLVRPGTDTTLAAAQGDYRSDPLGCRIPTTVRLGMAGTSLHSVYITDAHANADAADTNQENISELNQLYLEAPTSARVIPAALTTREIHEAGMAASTSQKNLAEAVVDPKQVIVVAIGESNFIRETGDDRGGEIIKKMFAELDKSNENGLYQYFKKRFGLSLTEPLLLDQALKKALDLTHTHFLDKDEGQVAPIFSAMPGQLAELIELKNKGLLSQTFLRPSRIHNIIDGLNEFYAGKSLFKANPSTFKRGRGALEFLSVIGETYQPILSPVADVISKNENDLLKSAMVSMVLDKRKPKSTTAALKEEQEMLSIGQKNAFRLREFTTAMASAYQEKGVFGVCQWSQYGIRIAYTPGEKNLILEKFGSEKDPQAAFAAAFIKALTDIIEILEMIKTRNTNPKRF